MERLGPFGPAPRIAVGVSGGADSSALAVLADAWARARGGAILALVVDHGLRLESSSESTDTMARLQARGIPARRLALDPAPSGPDISAVARAARHAALHDACREAGILFLALAHSRADQAETLLWRRLRGSLAAGLAGMAARREVDDLVVLRPLLGFSPAALRATCRAAGLAWVEDPTNRALRHARPRLRQLLADPAGEGAGIAALAEAAVRFGASRAAAEAALAEELAELVELRPEGFAQVARPQALSGQAAARLVQAIAGAPYAPQAARAAALVRAGQGTLQGVEASPAGRFGPGLVLAREPAALAASLAAGKGRARWDGRWLLDLPRPMRVGALGAASVPGRQRLPARLAAVLPAFRGADGGLLAVPALGWAADAEAARAAAWFAPPVPLAAAPFLPAPDDRTPRLQASAE